MKLYKNPAGGIIELKNANDYNIRWHSGYFTFYFPIENFYGKNDIYIFTCDKKTITETSKSLSILLKRLKNETVQIQ